MWQAERCMMGELRRRDEAAVDRFNSKYPYVAYHFFLPCDGGTYALRGEDEVGSHISPNQVLRAFNSDSLGAVLVGLDAYTLEQWDELRNLVVDVRRRYGEDLVVCGHRDVNHGRDCPGFDVAAWLASGMEPLPGHIITAPR